MDIEYIVFLLGILIIILCGWLGWKHGAASLIRHALTVIFAALFALRFWQPAFDFLMPVFKMDDGFVAAGSLLALFVIGGVVCGFVSQVLARSYFRGDRNVIDEGVGAALGLVSGALLAGILIASLGLIWPAAGMAFDFNKMPYRVDQWPVEAYGIFEEKVAQVEAGSSARTQFPSWKPIPAEVKEPPPPSLIWN